MAYYVNGKWTIDDGAYKFKIGVLVRYTFGIFMPTYRGKKLQMEHRNVLFAVQDIQP